MSSSAAELVALAPDVILAAGNAPVERLLQAIRTVPIVFVIVIDPVGSGIVLSQPGGNATGFMQFEYSFGAALNCSGAPKTWLRLRNPPN